MPQRRSNLLVDWSRHLQEGKEKDDFTSLVRNSRLVLGRLKDIIDERLHDLERTESNPETYDSGYPYRQAHINGIRKGLLDLRKLVEFLEA